MINADIRCRVIPCTIYNSVDTFRRGIIRFFHFHKFGVSQKFCSGTAGLVSTKLIPHVGLYAEHAQYLRVGDRDETQQAGNQHGTASQQIAFAQPKMPHLIIRTQRPRKQCDQHNADGDLPGHRQAVTACNGYSGTECLKVPRQNRCAAEDRNEVIRSAPHTGQNVQQHAADRRIADDRTADPVECAQTQPVGQSHAYAHIPRWRAEHKLHQPKRGKRCQQQQEQLLRPCVLAQRHITPRQQLPDQ